MDNTLLACGLACGSVKRNTEWEALILDMETGRAHPLVYVLVGREKASSFGFT